MTDLSKLSDEELQKLYAGTKAPAEMSDAELTAAHKATQPVASGSLLPFSRYPDGSVKFDSNAGIIGSAKRAFMLPDQVMRGEVSPNDTGRVLEMATTFSPVNPAFRAGDRAIPGVARAVKARPAAVPTATELKAAGAGQLTDAANSGLEIAAPAIVQWSRGIQQKLYDDAGITEINAPSTFALLKKFEDAPADAVASAKNLKSMREALGGVAQNFNPQAAKDQLAASRAIKALDEFVPNVDPASVVAGSPATTASLWKRGNANYAAAQRSNDITGELDRGITGILEQAELGAQVANSGRNIDNTIRQRIASVLKKEKEVSGLTDGEIDALVKAAEGGAGRNTARYIANVLGGGGGFGQALTSSPGAGGGLLAAGPAGAVVGAGIPAAAGAGAKSLANHLARKDIKGVDELMRTRSPLYQERVANPEMAVISPEKRAALARILMLQQLAPQQ